MGTWAKLATRARSLFTRSRAEDAPTREDPEAPARHDARSQEPEHEHQELRDIVHKRAEREAQLRRNSGGPGNVSGSGYF